MIFKLVSILSILALTLAHKHGCGPKPDCLCVCDPCPRPCDTVCLCPEKAGPFGTAGARKYSNCEVVDIPRQTCPIPLPCGYIKYKPQKLVVKRPCPVPRPCPKDYILPLLSVPVPVTPFPPPEAPEICVEDFAYCCPPRPCKICCCEDDQCKTSTPQFFCKPDCKVLCEPECNYERKLDCKVVCEPECNYKCKLDYKFVDKHCC